MADRVVTAGTATVCLPFPVLFISLGSHCAPRTCRRKLESDLDQCTRSLAVMGALIPEDSDDTQGPVGNEKQIGSEKWWETWATQAQRELQAFAEGERAGLRCVFVGGVRVPWFCYAH